MSEEKRWFAFYLRGRWEKRVADRLSEKGHEVFLPLIKTRRVWSDRKRWVMVPLIPSYVFVRIPASVVYDVLATDGVIKVIRFSGLPAPIPDNQIALIRSAVENSMDISITTETFHTGDVVEVIAGPLAGMRGVLVTIKGKHQVAMQLDHLEYAFLVTIQTNAIQKTGERISSQ